MKAGLQDLEVPSKRLMDSQLGSGDLVDWGSAATADAGAPDSQTADHISAADEA